MEIKNNTVKFTIYNMDIICTPHYIHIQNSYIIKDIKCMEYILEGIELFLINNAICIDTPLNYRSKKSMIREWIAHNNAYKLGYKRSRTAHADLEYPQKWYMKLLYCLIGIIKL